MHIGLVSFLFLTGDVVVTVIAIAIAIASVLVLVIVLAVILCFLLPLYKLYIFETF